MSTAATATPTEEAVKEAGQVIVKNVHAPVFFAKLAERGYRPTNDEEASSLLGIGFKLASVTPAEAPTQQPTNSFAKAASDLEVLLSSHRSGDAALEAAALELAGSPEIEKAAQTILQASAQ